MSCSAANTGAVTVFMCATGLSKWSVPAKGTYEVFGQVEAGQTVAYSVQVSGAGAAANKACYQGAVLQPPALWMLMLPEMLVLVVLSA